MTEEDASPKVRQRRVDTAEKERGTPPSEAPPAPRIGGPKFLGRFFAALESRGAASTSSRASSRSGSGSTTTTSAASSYSPSSRHRHSVNQNDTVKRRGSRESSFKPSENYFQKNHARSDFVRDVFVGQLLKLLLEVCALVILTLARLVLRISRVRSRPVPPALPPPQFLSFCPTTGAVRGFDALASHTYNVKSSKEFPSKSDEAKEASSTTSERSIPPLPDCVGSIGFSGCGNMAYYSYGCCHALLLALEQKRGRRDEEKSAELISAQKNVAKPSASGASSGAWVAMMFALEIDVLHALALSRARVKRYNFFRGAPLGCSDDFLDWTFPMLMLSVLEESSVSNKSSSTVQASTTFKNSPIDGESAALRVSELPVEVDALISARLGETRNPSSEEHIIRESSTTTTSGLGRKSCSPLRIGVTDFRPLPQHAEVTDFGGGGGNFPASGSSMLRPVEKLFATVSASCMLPMLSTTAVVLPGHGLCADGCLSRFTPLDVDLLVSPYPEQLPDVYPENTLPSHMVFSILHDDDILSAFETGFKDTVRWLRKSEEDVHLHRSEKSLEKLENKRLEIGENSILRRAERERAASAGDETAGADLGARTFLAVGARMVRERVKNMW